MWRHTARRCGFGASRVSKYLLAYELGGPCDAPSPDGLPLGVIGTRERLRDAPEPGRGRVERRARRRGTGGSGVSVSPVASDPSVLEVVDRTDHGVVARVSGDLDIVTSERVTTELARLIDAGHVLVTLDVADAGLLDSSGLG